jgi:hypothetical protein
VGVTDMPGPKNMGARPRRGVNKYV